MGSPPNKLDQHPPYLVSFSLDELMRGKPTINCSLDHELIKNVIVSAEESCNMMQNPSSSSSSSSPPIIHENPNTNVWDDQMRNPNLPPSEMSSSAEFTLGNYLIRTGAMRNINQEDFLHSQAPLMMTKIDQEYFNWQQQEMIDHTMQAQTTVVGSNFQGFDKNKVVDLGDLEKMGVTAAQVVGKSADSHLESEKNGVFSDEPMAKSVERRQRRMIKNRESAAKSRARKQVICINFSSFFYITFLLDWY